MKIKPLVERFSSEYWKTEISKGEERAKKFTEAAEESIRIYNAQKHFGVLNDAERRLNSWWYCVNTLIPAYFSSTPKAEVNLRKRTGGIIEEMSAVGLERNTQYCMDCDFSFDAVGYNYALQLLLAGRAVSWARYKVDIEDEEMEIALFQAPDGSLIDDKGQPFTGDASDSKPGPGGLVLVKVSVPRKREECAVLDAVQYNDYFCSDARNETEIEWRARRAYLGRSEAEDLFGDEIADKLHYDSYPDKDKKDWRRSDDKYEGKAEVFEIWCEEAGKVYWGHNGTDKFVIQESEPPIDFEGFYPCAVICQNLDPDSVIPVSDYSHVKDQILEVERLTTRIHAVTETIRTNGLYDAALGPSVEELMVGDLKMIPVQNWPSHKSRGGIQASVEFMDISPYVNALQILQGARQQALEQLYETLKVSDLLRGTSQQYKSATANRLEAQWSSLGLVVRQNMFAKFISASIEKLATIVASQFDPEKFFEVADLDRMIVGILPPPPPPPAPGPDGQMPMGPPPPDPQLQVAAIKQQIINLLRSKDKLMYRVQIASDSMVAVDQAQEQQEGAQLMATCGDFFNQMKSLIEQYPPLLGFSIELFQSVIKRFKSGKELDGIFTKALGQIGEIAKAREEAAKQPPPPDPIVQEMQGRMQIAQMEAQVKTQAAQMQMQDAHEKNALAVQELQMKMQKEQLTAQQSIQKMQMDQYALEQDGLFRQQELQIKANAVQVDMLKVQATSESDANKQAITQETNRMAQILEIQKLELEQMRIKWSESEKLMEERRLSSEQEIERLRVSMDQFKSEPLKSAQQTPIVINNVIPKSARRVGRITSDELGNTSIDIDDVRDELEG